MNKKFTKLVSLVMALGMVGAATACGGKSDSDSEQTLDIYLLYKGFGDAWLTSTTELFKQQDWVKEKYPELQINYTYDSVDATAPQKITAGASINKYDLMFGVNLQGYESKGLISDLTDSVYLSEVPGESGVKVIDKVPQNVLDKVKNTSAKAHSDGNDTYNVVSYIDGVRSMYYNADILKALGLEVPVTTDEFLETAATIKQKKYASSLGSGEDTVIINAAEDNYWETTFDVWWAQYEGVESYLNYFEGYDPVEAKYGSSSVLDQKGREEALKVIDAMISQYSYKNALEVDYKKAQTAFLSGVGVFHYNGDYFAPEMQLEMDALKAENIEYDIRMMRMPVISSIINNLPEGSITSDTQLRSVIREIDNDKTWDESQAKIDGVKQADFEKVASARCVMGYRAASSQAAVVPSYAAAQELAADYLRFMYTDTAIRNFTIASKGTIFPSTYDILGDTEVMASVSSIEKSKMELLAGSSNYQFTSLVAASTTTLGKAGLTSLYFSGEFETMFVQTGANKMSVAKILEAEKSHWNQNTWDQMVAASGLN